MDKKTSKKINNLKGAALIMALLVITVVSGITFYASRLTIKEIVMMSRIEDSMNAYYAAEAGIEQGFMMWRSNHDVELSQDCQRYPCNNPPDIKSSPLEFKIDENRSYKLKIWYRNEAGKSVTGELGKDEAVEFDISNLNSFSNLFLSWNSADGSLLGSQDYMEYSVINQNNFVNDKNLLSSTKLNNNKISISSGDVKLRLHAWGDKKKKYTLSAGPNDRLDSGTTVIESTGIFRDSVQRKLQVTIDRKSGKIISIFDFMLFGGGTEGIDIRP